MSKDFIARLVIYGLPDMNAKELRRLRAWLKKQEELIESMLMHNTEDEYSKRFIARLMK